jgi:hypothetical protein
MTVLGRYHGYRELRVGLRGRELGAASGCRTALVRGTITRLGGACRMQACRAPGLLARAQLVPIPARLEG